MPTYQGNESDSQIETNICPNTLTSADILTHNVAASVFNHHVKSW